jgi:hypothetical protein
MAYGFIVFLVQFAIMVLLVTDLTKFNATYNGHEMEVEGEESDNPWNIPMNVTVPVAISQFLAIIVAVISQDDVLKSIEAVFVADYDAAIVGAAGCRNSTRYRWYFSNFLRWFEGMMTLFIILIVVAQVSIVTLSPCAFFRFKNSIFLIVPPHVAAHLQQIKTDNVLGES